MPKIRIKRGTTSQWLASTTPLLTGELGYDLTTKVIKIGDGTSLWANLSSYSGGTGGTNGLDSLFLGTWNSVTEFLAAHQGGPVGLADGDWWAFVKDNSNPNKIYVVREDPNSATGWVIDDNEHFVLPQGPQGDPGEQGVPGTAGAGFGIFYLGNYNPSSGYVPDIAVVRGSDGQLYLAKASGALGDPVGNTAQWEVWIPKGQDGAPGTNGADALWNYVGEYSGGASYAVGDVVTFDGQLWYRYNSNGGNVGDTPSPGLWNLLAAKGADGTNGTNGTSLTARGAWTDSENYAINDIVTFEGSSYVCIVGVTAGTDVAPYPQHIGAYWQLLAQGGSSSADIADFIFTEIDEYSSSISLPGDKNMTISAGADSDLYLTAGDDLYIQTLGAGDDIHLNAADDIRFTTGNENIDFYTPPDWRMNSEGRFVLPGGGYITNPIESSGDGSDLSTINLFPDGNIASDQYVIIDPTSPNHIHLRAGGVQDNSSAHIFIGGERNNIEVSDPYRTVKISTKPDGTENTYANSNGTSNTEFVHASTADILPGDTVRLYTGGPTYVVDNVTQEYPYAGAITVTAPGLSFITGEAYVFTRDQGNNNQWTFANDAKIYFPNGSIMETPMNEGHLTMYASTSATANGGYVEISGGNASNDNKTGGTVNILGGGVGGYNSTGGNVVLETSSSGKILLSGNGGEFLNDMSNPDNQIATMGNIADANEYTDTAISGLGNSIDGTYVPISLVGVADGVATLGADGKIPDSEIPAGIARDTEIPSLTGYATETYVGTAISTLLNSAPESLNTLKELADALGSDVNFSTTVTTSLGNKLDSSTAATTYLSISQPSVDYYITNSGSGGYLVNGVLNGTINFVKGKKYRIVVNATGHPFWVQTVSGAYSAGDVYSTGITNAGEDNGAILVELAQSAPDNLYYACQYHSSMQGSINSTVEGAALISAKSSSYTILPSDGLSIIEMSAGGTLTISDSSSFPVGFSVDILQTGASQVTIAGTSFTPNATPGLKLRTQWSSATLIKRALNSWVVLGDLSA